LKAHDAVEGNCSSFDQPTNLVGRSHGYHLQADFEGAARSHSQSLNYSKRSSWKIAHDHEMDEPCDFAVSFCHGELQSQDNLG